MIRILGNAVSSGIVMGRLLEYKKNIHETRKTIKDVKAEIQRATLAKEQAQGQLRDLAVGEEGGIFEAQAMLLDDPMYVGYVENTIIEQSLNAEYAISLAREHFMELFQAMEDTYFQARALDIADVSNRWISCLGQNADELIVEEESILFAEELLPSDTVKFDRSKVKGFVTMKGGSNSHTAILARSMGVPAICGIDMEREINTETYDEELGWNGSYAILDADQGFLIVNPTEDEILIYRRKILEQDVKKKEWEIKSTREDISGTLLLPNHHMIKLFANISLPEDVDAVLENKAEGIGLFRTEFMYIGRECPPTEEELFEAYKKVLKDMGDRRVIIRTIDLGGDKSVEYIPNEENLRGIALCLANQDLFRTQLRALYRASAFGNLAVMYPMVSKLEEIKEILCINKEVSHDLKCQGITIGNFKQGMMVETIASVERIEEFAKYVDFFSVGTNDLIQEILGVNRELDVDGKEGENPWNHDVRLLSALTLVADVAKENRIPVGICGELASDCSMIEKVAEMGFAYISVAPSMLFPIRDHFM